MLQLVMLQLLPVNLMIYFHRTAISHNTKVITRLNLSQVLMVQPKLKLASSYSDYMDLEITVATQS